MFKLSITSRWAPMAARGWAKLILDRRRDLINDRPNRATAAEAPLDGAQERYHFDNSTTHTRRISPSRSSIAHLLCPVPYAYDLAPSLGGETRKNGHSTAGHGGDSTTRLRTHVLTHKNGHSTARSSTQFVVDF